MNKELSNFAAHLRATISVGDDVRSLTSTCGKNNEPPNVGSYDINFDELALELFSLQFAHNSAYRKICEARKLTPEVVEHWSQIPFVPTSAFKELELTSLTSVQRTSVFHSSGTTEQKPSRHFHSAESLELYKASLWTWFQTSVHNCRLSIADCRFQGLVCLTPRPEETPHSSLVHMFETVRQRLGAPESAFVGQLDADGAWALDFGAVLDLLNPRPQTQDPGSQAPDPRAFLLVGTAFSFVHLVDYLAEKDLRLQLSNGSRVMETGGYKNRSRTMPKTELHALITEYLGVPAEDIICEYGMSELSSQAYDSNLEKTSNHRDSVLECGPDKSGPLSNMTGTLKAPEDWRTPQPRGSMQPAHGKGASSHQPRIFHFPAWARVQIISPETGREVAEGETGLIRIFDLANVFSVAAIQTEDLAIRRGDGFELIGRAKLAEARGCSLMTA
ncbi:MAG TPA: hypothetical protein VGN23_05360 [Verrucomicrobiae bacterium]|jgi:hypothetical protein